MPALTPILFFRGQPSGILSESLLSSVTPVYTVPSGKRAIVKYVRVTNLLDSAGTFINMKIGLAINTSDGDYVFRNITIQPSDVLIFEMNEVLNAGDKIFVWDNISNDLSMQISGIEVTL